MQYAKLRTYCVLPIISSERTDRNAGSVEHCSLRVIADTIADSNCTLAKGKATLEVNTSHCRTQNCAGDRNLGIDMAIGASAVYDIVSGGCLDIVTVITFCGFHATQLQRVDLQSGKAEVLARSQVPERVVVRDTICRQVAGREGHLKEFSKGCDLVVFVCGAKSSNGKVLFEACHSANPNSIKIESPEELRKEMFEGVENVGNCGATSTPHWLMERVRDTILRLSEAL